MITRLSIFLVAMIAIVFGLWYNGKYDKVFLPALICVIMIVLEGLYLCYK